MIKGFNYWPAQSPDLNPIEHLWWALECRVESRRSEVKNTDQLKKVLEEEWKMIDSDLITRLIDSMKDSCQAVIDANGGTTKY